MHLLSKCFLLLADLTLFSLPLNYFLNSDFLGNFSAITRLFFIPGRKSEAAATGEILNTKQQLCNPYQP